MWMCVALLHISVAHIFYILHLLSVLFPLLCLFQRSQHTKTTKQKMQFISWLDRFIHINRIIKTKLSYANRIYCRMSEHLPTGT